MGPRFAVESLAGTGKHGLTKLYDAKHTILNPQLLSLSATALSLLVLLLQASRSSRKSGAVAGFSARINYLESENTLKHLAKSHGGSIRLSFMLARFIGCLTLLVLSVTTTFLQKGSDSDGLSHLHEWEQWSLPMLFLYASFLSCVSLVSYRWSSTTTRHNVFLLLVIFAIYAYRDMWPLVTTTKTPQDIAEGPFLWAKLALVNFTAVFIPLFVPRQYVPVDPTKPMSKPNPEQTASIFSAMFYFFMDDIIWKASKVEHLSFTELPPLADSDRAGYLEEKGFPHLDPFSGAKRRHIFFRLLRVFRKEFVIQSILMVVQSLASFGAPIGINRILSYLEHGASSTIIRPWFWIGWLFLGPILYGASQQAFTYVVTKTMVNAQSMLTQLVFEHSLRIRMKAETSDNLQTDVDEGAADAKKPTSRVDNMIGKLNNLMTSDMSNMTTAVDFLIPLLGSPLQICFGILFLYNILGVSAFVGLFAMVVLSPVPRFIVKKLGAIQVEKMKLTDVRVQTVTEAVNVLRMVKMFAWESRMNERIQRSRRSELNMLWKRKLYTIAAIIMISTFAFYTVVMKQELSASKIFSSTPVFSLIRMEFYKVSSMMNKMVRGKISLDRLDDFLQNTELLDVYFFRRQHSDVPAHCLDVVGFKDSSFSWANEEDGTMTPSFRLRIQGELFFMKGCVNLITGPTGTGKTSMLMALLGEMHFIPSSSEAWFNLPRGGGVAYAAQESWVQNDTIRNNILFGSSFDEGRYNKVIYQCALKQDIDLFDAGDQTEVGERGLTLRYARVTLARAIYSSAEIILLDDILAALDAHTSKWIVEECLLGDLVRGRTLLLVTHNVALTRPIAHFVVDVGLDGVISTETSTPIDHLPSNVLQVTEDITSKSAPALEVIEDSKSKTDGKLIIPEEIVKGRVGWKAMKLFISALGGKYAALYFTIWITGIISADVANNFQTWYLGFWGSQYETGRPVQASYYLSIYFFIFIATLIMRTGTMIHYTVGTLRAAKIIHNILVGSILGSTLRWLDETPVARIITRCTQDMGSVDEPLGEAWSAVVELVVSAMVKLGGVVIFTPIFLLPGLAIAVVGYWTARIYLKAQLSVKREMSNAKAPIIAHFGATVAGLVSVRAYGVQLSFKEELLSRVDHYAWIARVSWNLNRWIGVRMAFLGALFTTSLAAYLVFTRSANAANTGFSLTVALEFCTMILWCVRLYNDFEVQSNSLERIQSYIEVEQEKPSTEAGKPPASWPASGDLRVEDLSARYSANSPEVLHGLSFHIRSGERVGVVGRTGSGKHADAFIASMHPHWGHVHYDGIATDKINLESLRSSITIIPQMPELLSGTLRKNLDPFDEHDDSVLNATLKYAGLFSLQDDANEAWITLDTKIASGGTNLSVGQRQIIALARAMVRESKLLILDEGRNIPVIDYKTDTLIQNALRSKLSSDVTVITIAHRLQTIMDADKIIVLDAGNLVEFDSPKALLRREDGVFKRLVDNSGDSATLRAIAFGNART
ncbi:multidrug resistance-associated ABC transporter [Cyathus striatus]|nr:multidrug resistance-associated ABC transporter [Cyathus striatus]